MLTRPTERHPAGCDYRAQFPALQLVRGFEGGAIYRAEENGLGVLISDESTMTEFLGADEADLIDERHRLCSSSLSGCAPQNVSRHPKSAHNFRLPT